MVLGALFGPLALGPDLVAFESNAIARDLSNSIGNVVARVVLRIRRLRAQGNLFSRINVIWVVQPHLQKYFPFRLTQITFTTPAVSFPEEGRIAIITDVGNGMRWTRRRA